jgi:hypothetical protein
VKRHFHRYKYFSRYIKVIDMIFWTGSAETKFVWGEDLSDVGKCNTIHVIYRLCPSVGTTEACYSPSQINLPRYAQEESHVTCRGQAGNWQKLLAIVKRWHKQYSHVPTLRLNAEHWHWVGNLHASQPYRFLLRLLYDPCAASAPTGSPPFLGPETSRSQVLNWCPSPKEDVWESQGACESQ